MKKKLLALSVLTAISSQAGAFEFDTGDNWSIRWDNTFKANVMSRVEKQNKELIAPSGRNPEPAWYLADDADLSVDRSSLGLVSTRLDLLTEFDLIYKDSFGFRISAAGWYDYMYKDESDHPRDRRLSWASPSVRPGKYTDETQDLHYFGGEVLDAFVFANWDMGNMAANVRLGRHTIYWGQTLLGTGATHGAASAMAPLDFNKALSVPGSEAKELFMPTAKISTVIQLTDNATLNAFYNFEHQEYRLPGTGSYFSPAEGLTEDTEFGSVFSQSEVLRAGVEFEKDETDWGDWGINFQYYVEPWSLETSFIYMNYVDKIQHGLIGGVDFGSLSYLQAAAGNPTFEGLIAAWTGICAADPSVACPNPPVIDQDAGTASAGKAKWQYKNDIDLYAIAFSKEIAGVSTGLEIAHRRNTALPPELSQSLQSFVNVPAFVEALGLASNIDYENADSDNYIGAVGNTWHVIMNGLGLLSDNGFWEGGSWIVEATFSMLEECTEYCEYLDVRVNEDRIVSHIGAVFRPTWYQVWPGTDMTLIGAVSYTIDGEKAPISFGGDEEGGNASLGAEFLINQAWTFTARYNAFFGPSTAGIGGLLKDRDNVSLTLKRTF